MQLDEKINTTIDGQTIAAWLRQTDEKRLEPLWKKADTLRHQHVGDQVHLRGLIEISNHCTRQCTYCGLRAGNADLQRYRMTETEIMDCVEKAVAFGYGTVVMQAGEDYGLTRDYLTTIIRRIKESTPLAVTLSMGERPLDDLEAWRHAGADRYLLRFETSNKDLYERIHPSRPGQQYDRLEMLQRIGELGYEVGSGVMIGIPGQTYESLAADICLFRSLDLDMIGVGPFIAHPGTPLGLELTKQPNGTRIDTQDQVPDTELMAYKVIALTRLVCPQANIPSTTALATINTATGRELGLSRGANVVMPNLTPVKYRELYEIYPGKACINETAQQCQRCLRGRIASIGRTVGTGRGDRARSEDKKV